MSEARWITADALAKNPELKAGMRTIESCHLHFNGPGASGFGVKRTAMLLPESVMLLVAPACCGRHGTVTGKKTGFDDRMFYLQIDERDLVTGNYLKRIPEAAAYIKEKYDPKVLYLCMTCVDAIMGTDLARIGREIEASSGMRVTASFMDPISRESRRAPMVSVIRSLFSALNPSEMKNDRVNILGGFVPMCRDNELFSILNAAGKTDIKEISACTTFDEYQEMAGASLNIVIHPQAVAAAKDMEDRFGIKYIVLDKTYGIERTRQQLKKLTDHFGMSSEMIPDDTQARVALKRFTEKYKDMKIAVGEAVSGNPFEIALTLIEAGISVPWVLRNIVTEKDIEYIKRLAAVAPELRIYSGVHPDSQTEGLPHVETVIGMDGAYLAGSRSSVNFGMETEDFGYHALIQLLEETGKMIEDPVEHRRLMHGSYLTV